MLVIRLARGGRKNLASYRIVAAEKRFAATGRYVEILGRYNPHTKELVIDKEAISKRVDQGAQPSNAVLKLMQKEGMALPKWAAIATKTRDPKKAVEETVEKATETETEQPTEATAEVASQASDAAEAKASDAKTEAGETSQADASAQDAAADAAEVATKEVASKEATPKEATAEAKSDAK